MIHNKDKPGDGRGNILNNKGNVDSAVRKGDGGDFVGRNISRGPAGRRPRVKDKMEALKKVAEMGFKGLKAKKVSELHGKKKWMLNLHDRGEQLKNAVSDFQQKMELIEGWFGGDDGTWAKYGALQAPYNQAVQILGHAQQIGEIGGKILDKVANAGMVFYEGFYSRLNEGYKGEYAQEFKEFLGMMDEVSEQLVGFASGDMGAMTTEAMNKFVDRLGCEVLLFEGFINKLPDGEYKTMANQVMRDVKQELGSLGKAFVDLKAKGFDKDDLGEFMAVVEKKAGQEFSSYPYVKAILLGLILLIVVAACLMTFSIGAGFLLGGGYIGLSLLTVGVSAGGVLGALKFIPSWLDEAERMNGEFRAIQDLSKKLIKPEGGWDLGRVLDDLGIDVPKEDTRVRLGKGLDEQDDLLDPVGGGGELNDVRVDQEESNIGEEPRIHQNLEPLNESFDEKEKDSFGGKISSKNFFSDMPDEYFRKEEWGGNKSEIRPGSDSKLSSQVKYSQQDIQRYAQQGGILGEEDFQNLEWDELTKEEYLRCKLRALRDYALKCEKGSDHRKKLLREMLFVGGKLSELRKEVNSSQKPSEVSTSGLGGSNSNIRIEPNKKPEGENLNIFNNVGENNPEKRKSLWMGHRIETLNQLDGQGFTNQDKTHILRGRMNLLKDSLEELKGNNTKEGLMRIQSLEKELKNVKKILEDHQRKVEDEDNFNSIDDDDSEGSDSEHDN